MKIHDAGPGKTARGGTASEIDTVDWDSYTTFEDAKELKSDSLDTWVPQTSPRTIDDDLKCVGLGPSHGLQPCYLPQRSDVSSNNSYSAGFCPDEQYSLSREDLIEDFVNINTPNDDDDIHSIHVEDEDAAHSVGPSAESTLTLAAGVSLEQSDSWAEVHMPHKHQISREPVHTGVPGPYPAAIEDEEFQGIPSAARQSSDAPIFLHDTYTSGQVNVPQDNGTTYGAAAISYYQPSSYAWHVDGGINTVDRNLAPSHFVPSQSPSAISIPPSYYPDPLQCSVDGCSVYFRGVHRRGNQQRHVRLVHGQRWYVCSIYGCAKSYRRSDALNKHRRLHHNG